jgi:hypothetical protein
MLSSGSDLAIEYLREFETKFRNILGYELEKTEC